MTRSWLTNDNIDAILVPDSLLERRSCASFAEAFFFFPEADGGPAFAIPTRWSRAGADSAQRY